MKFDILNRFNGAVQISVEINCHIDALPSVKLGFAIKAAVKERADLQRADLRGADLRGADLRGAYLRGAYLQGADLQDAYLRDAYLQGAYLRGAYLRGAYIDNDPKIDGWKFENGRLWRI